NFKQLKPISSSVKNLPRTIRPIWFKVIFKAIQSSADSWQFGHAVLNTHPEAPEQETVVSSDANTTVLQSAFHSKVQAIDLIPVNAGFDNPVASHNLGP